MIEDLRSQINVPDMHKKYYERGNTAILAIAKTVVAEAEGRPNPVTQGHAEVAHHVAYGVQPDVEAVVAAEDPSQRVIALADLERNVENATRVVLSVLSPR